MCGVFLVDSSFMVEGSKFISGTMAALSVMVNISIPHVNVLTKMDLLNAESRSQLERWAEPAAMRSLFQFVVVMGLVRSAASVLSLPVSVGHC